MPRRKRSSRDRFEIARGLAKDHWREHEQAIHGFMEAAGTLGPEYAAHLAFEAVLTERRCWRRFLRRRFGARIVNTDGDDRIVEIKNWPGREFVGRISSGREPQTGEEWKRLGRKLSKEEFLLLFAMQQHAIWELSWRTMLGKGVRVLEEPGAESWSRGEKKTRVLLAALEGFILAQQNRYELLGLTTGPDTLSPSVREAVAAMLTGQVEATMSLTKNKRLAAVLGEHGGDARKRLVEEFPGAVMQEWGAGETVLAGGKYRAFTQRVARALERTGNEDNSLARRGKRSPLGDMTETADDILEFERREEARQKLDALEQEAKLSKQQTEIWRRLRRGMEIAEIAAELDIPKRQVSTQKKRIKRKVQKVRAAAGF